MRILFSVSLVSLVTVMSAGPKHRALADQWPPVELDAATVRIEEALADTTTMEFIETPLEDVVAYLKDLHGIEIQIDARALDEVGLGTDAPVTQNLKGISLRSALRLLLREFDLTFVIQDEVLLISTPEEQETQFVLRVYNVKALLGEEQTAQDLLDVIVEAAPEHEFHEAGARITTFRELLIVRGNYSQQRYVSQMLGTLANGLGVEPEKPAIVEDPPEPLLREVRRVRREPARRVARADADPFDGDPFGGGPADPFGGGGGDPFGDPFGGEPFDGGDPFGGGGGEDDPFGDGGGDSPFGEPQPQEPEGPMPRVGEPNDSETDNNPFG